MHMLRVDDRSRIGHIRTDQESCHDIAQDKRLLKPLEDKSHNARHRQNKGQITYQLR